MVVDLQDVGVRFYTYAATMGYVMEEAAKRKIAGRRARSAESDQRLADRRARGRTRPFVSFIAYLPAMPIRHGMTLGELAQLFNDEKKIGADLTVVPMANWRRDRWFDQTGLPWINPSPNMRNLNQATLYPGIGAIEYANVSVGRGTDQPFEQIGAPWIDGRALAAALNARGLPASASIRSRSRRPRASTPSEVCQGVFMVITNRAALQPVRVGLEIAVALWKLHGDRYRDGDHRAPVWLA